MAVLNFKVQRPLDREKFWIARRFFLEPGILKESDHGLRAGGKAGYYFDIDYILNDPAKCELILGIYTDLITKIRSLEQINLLAFIEKASGGTVGALRLSAALSIKTNLPNLTVRPGKAIEFEKVKIPFVERKMPGIQGGLQGHRAIVVTDHCTSGKEALIAVKILRKHHAIVQNVVSYTLRKDRFEKYEHEYKNAEVDLIYAYGLPSKEQLPQNHSQLDAIAVNF